MKALQSKFTIHFATINTKSNVDLTKNIITFTIHFATINTNGNLKLI